MGSRTAFFDAIKAGDQPAVIAALDDNPELVHEQGDEGVGPVALASYHGHPELANALVDRGATVDVFVAGIVGRTEALRQMLESDRSLARAWSGDGWTVSERCSSPFSASAARALISS